jgi:ketosteroid isomerase-like protein
MPSNMPAASGTAAIQAYYEQVFAQMTAQGSATPAGIDVAGDWAIERGSFKTTLTPKAGGAPMEDTGKYVVVGKKTGTGWKLHYLIWNSDMPLPGAP